MAAFATQSQELRATLHRRRRFTRRRFITQTLAGAAAGATVVAARGRWPRAAAPAAAQESGAAAAIHEEPPSVRFVVPAIASDGEEPVPTLREKIGAMVMTGFRGQSIESESAIGGQLGAGHLGGVILFDRPGARNIASPSALATLTSELQGLAPHALIIATDQEGGTVARLGPGGGFPATRAAAEFGLIDDPAITYAAAAELADTLRRAGVNLNLAPVVDLNVNRGNPVIGAFGRSFSADPHVVIRHARAFIQAHHDHGILCTLKHFPGHGSSTKDSHAGFVDITDTWAEAELEPYAALIAEDLVDVVMTAHVFAANLDATYPATLSRAIVSGLLRDQLGYDGVVMSDAMEMAAISQNYGFEAAVELAIEAGVDILLFTSEVRPDGTNLAGAVVDLVEGRVASGAIPEERITASFDRIQRLRERL